MAQFVREKLDAHYPAASDNLNRELVQLLVFLDSPEVIAKTLVLLDSATTREQQVYYLYYLRNVKSGWTLAQREKYFNWFVPAAADRPHPGELVQWFKDVGRDYADGNSYEKYLANISKDAMETLTGSEREALRPTLELASPQPAWKPVKKRTFSKEWKLDDLTSALDGVGSGRDFKSGKAAFNDAQCIVCHRFGNSGGLVGPELTGAASKYSRQSILESIIEPSKVISDQYQSTTIFKKDGDDVSGRLLEETKDHVVMLPNMLKPQETVTIPLSEIASRRVSKLSAMPAGLVNQLTQEEILDLLAYIESMGKPKAKNFKE